MAGKNDAADIYNHIVDIVRAVRSNKKIELFRGGMEKLNFAQIFALYFLYDSEELTMGEMAALARVQMPTMTDIMTKLVNCGYAARKHSKTDRRKVIMTITAKGRKLVDFNRGIGIDYIDKYLSNLNNVEKKIVNVFIKRTKEIIAQRYEK
jgi:MarR family transcriptional regulator, organic hydroperoxide resistance regulator